ncbi:histidinol dehydrogenase [Candidatus Vidania fulgoroideae]|uniref:Histidinol dehydrogenase n=1 Tax=Candidatus Vidania fulgoroideorum TaxID=881286 RepID=A0A975ADS1_9PROT|nr:histidinol dehydrogenase [Candidatus Vidania fulgoroideae]
MIRLLHYNDLRKLIITNYGDSSSILVNRILKYVIRYGDDALVALSKRYECRNIRKSDISIKINDIDFSGLDLNIKRNLLSCRNRIVGFHKRQLREIGLKSWFIKNSLNNVLGQACIPIKRVGVYIPGGKKIYPSSVFMNCVPAILSGVKKIYSCTPARLNKNNLPVFYAFKILGIDNIYNIGGAQAIAALAFGTKRIHKVNKIIGPGNRFVNTAKKLVFGSVGIDTLAGPTEIGIYFDRDIKIKKIAYELFSQIEHDDKCLSFVVSNNKKGIFKFYHKSKKFLIRNRFNPKIRIISKCFGRTMFFYNRKTRLCFKISNFLAPEHFSLLSNNPIRHIGNIKTPGSIFIGRYNSESFGDYSIGTNHVLPTNRCSKFSSVLNVNDFMLIKNISFIRYKEQKLTDIASSISKIERLFFHYKNSICC